MPIRCTTRSQFALLAITLLTPLARAQEPDADESTRSTNGNSDAPAAAPGEGSPTRPPVADSKGAPEPTLEKWVFEPVALEGGVFRVLIDRRDSSFALSDRYTNTPWHSSWKRRGFASLLLKEPAGEPRWVAVDRVLNPSAREKRFQFVGGSSQVDELPPVRFVMELDPGGTLFVLRYEIQPEAAERVLAVRLLDDGLWIHHDGGAAIVPRGVGEYFPKEGDVERLWMSGTTGFPRRGKLVEQTETSPAQSGVRRRCWR